MRGTGWVMVMILIALPSMVASLAPAADRVAQGKAAFEQYCVACHGSGGHGDGPMAASLNPKPKDFAEKAYNRSLKDDHLVKTITEGGQSVGKSPAMPKFGGILKPDQVKDVIAFLRSLAK